MASGVEAPNSLHDRLLGKAEIEKLASGDHLVRTGSDDGRKPFGDLTADGSVSSAEDAAVVVVQAAVPLSGATGLPKPLVCFCQKTNGACFEQQLDLLGAFADMDVRHM